LPFELSQTKGTKSIVNHYQLYDPYKKQGVQARSETALAHLVYYFDHKPYIMQ